MDKMKDKTMIKITTKVMDLIRKNTSKGLGKSEAIKATYDTMNKDYPVIFNVYLKRAAEIKKIF